MGCELNFRQTGCQRDTPVMAGGLAPVAGDTASGADLVAKAAADPDHGAQRAWPTVAFGGSAPAGGARAALPFRAVNRPGHPGYDPGFQRHHLLPRQLLSARCFGPLLDEIGRARFGFDDFRSNGLLLPANDAAAVRIGLPMHRGPHRDYNALVIERVGEVEENWARLRLRAPEIAADEAIQRLGALQQSLRQRLLSPGHARLRLNRQDPFGRPRDFAAIDMLVDELWPATDATAQPPSPAPNDGAIIHVPILGRIGAPVGRVAPPRRHVAGTVIRRAIDPPRDQADIPNSLARAS